MNTRTDQPQIPSTLSVMTAEQRFASIVETLASQSEISPAKMFGSVGLKVRGKVFAMLVKGKLVVKLPQERVTALIASGVGEHFEPGHRRIMKEWVAIQPSSQSEWLNLAEEAKGFVASPR